MKKLIVASVCLLAASGMYAQVPVNIGKGAEKAVQTTKTVVGIPALEAAVENVVKTAERNISEVAYFHRLGSGDFWQEPPAQRPPHWSQYALKKEDTQLLSAPPVKSTVSKPKSPRKDV